MIEMLCGGRVALQYVTQLARQVPGTSKRGEQVGGRKAQFFGQGKAQLCAEGLIVCKGDDVPAVHAYIY